MESSENKTVNQSAGGASTNGKVGAVMVLGAGVGGIQASLDLADMGYKVYLVENTGSIGGAMAQLDKTFPTNDCSMCLLSPKLVDTARHPNIEIITNAEVQKLDGQAGNFTVTIDKRPRYINEEKCTGCGTCMNNCPVRNIAHFEEVDELSKVQLNEDDRERLEHILAKYKSERAEVLPILQDINARYGYLPPDVLCHTAQYLNIPLSQIYGMATFYDTFSLTPRGKYTIKVCTGTACYVKGAQRILEAFERELNINTGQTTRDKKFSLSTVNCLGCCGQSPVVMINDDILGYVKQTQVSEILGSIIEEEQNGQDHD